MEKSTINYKWPFSIAVCMFTKGYQQTLQNQDTADAGVAVGELLRERDAADLVASAFLVASLRGAGHQGLGQVIVPHRWDIHSMTRKIAVIALLF